VEIGGIPLGDVLNGSGWAVAFWVVWYIGRMVYLGRLIPKSLHDKALEAVQTERKRADLQAQQIEEINDSLRTLDQFVRSLPQPPSPSKPRGGARP